MVFIIPLCIHAFVSNEAEAEVMSVIGKKSFILGSNVFILNTLKDTTITVYGNCSSCKKAIEKAAKSVKGVEYASWDKKKKMLNIQYESSVTSLNFIEKAIIDIGYDTENMRAEDSVYDNLHQCCKYDRKPR